MGKLYLLLSSVKNAHKRKLIPFLPHVVYLFICSRAYLKNHASEIPGNACRQTDVETGCLEFFVIDLGAASYVRRQRDTTRNRPLHTALLSAVQQSVDICCRPGPQQQTLQTDRRTDGRTDDRCIDLAPRTTRAVPITSTATVKGRSHIRCAFLRCASRNTRSVYASAAQQRAEYV